MEEKDIVSNLGANTDQKDVVDREVVDFLND